jgi:YesN/AraC family two-component response regulator
MTLVAQHEPDVLITDIEMPEMSGLTLAAKCMASIRVCTL